MRSLPAQWFSSSRPVRLLLPLADKLKRRTQNYWRCCAQLQTSPTHFTQYAPASLTNHRCDGARVRKLLIFTRKARRPFSTVVVIQASPPRSILCCNSCCKRSCSAAVEVGKACRRKSETADRGLDRRHAFEVFQIIDASCQILSKPDLMFNYRRIPRPAHEL